MTAILGALATNGWTAVVGMVGGWVAWTQLQTTTCGLQGCITEATLLVTFTAGSQMIFAGAVIGDCRA